MPKVEPSGYAKGLMGVALVPASDLDRANAEIERLTKQRDALAKDFFFFYGEQNGYDFADVKFADDFGLKFADGTVTEIDHG